MKKSTEVYREYNKGIGLRIKKTRNLKNLSQMQLADQLNVSYQQVQKYEYGSSFVTVSRLKQISDVLSIPITAFIEQEAGGMDIFKLNKKEIGLINLFRELGGMKEKNKVVVLLEEMLVLAKD